jgi:AraC-like DNA-binding protein
MDPLSELLSLIGTRDSYFAAVKAGDDWAIRFPAPNGVKFNAIVQGRCWLSVEGVQPPIELYRGDCYLLTASKPYTLASAPDIPALDGPEIFRRTHDNIVHLGSASEFFLIGGRYTFCNEAHIVLDGLPPVAILRRESDKASVLHWALQRLSHEIGRPSPGRSLIIQHLGHLMLVQFLRQYFESGQPLAAGWLRASLDSKLSRVIHAIHADPAHRWSVESLADLAVMSRSTFALRFKQEMGIAPLEYVARWRMLLASRELTRTRATIGAIAEQLGYESDSAFSSAFKRMMACSPTEYRQRHAATA